MDHDPLAALLSAVEEIEAAGGVQEEPTTIEVAVRVRADDEEERSSVVKCLDEHTIAVLDSEGAEKERRSYDVVFGGSITQEQIFTAFGLSTVISTLRGFNSAIFAYGQTGSGKTFTMNGTAVDRGLIQNICTSLFACAGRLNRRTVEFTLSYYEIYNERVRDLLNPQFLPFEDDDEEDALQQRKSLPVREHKKLGVRLRPTQLL